METKLGQPNLKFPTPMQQCWSGLCCILRVNLEGKKFLQSKGIFVHLSWDKPQPLEWVKSDLLLGNYLIQVYVVRSGLGRDMAHSSTADSAHLADSICISPPIPPASMLLSKEVTGSSRHCSLDCFLLSGTPISVISSQEHLIL